MEEEKAAHPLDTEAAKELLRTLLETNPAVELLEPDAVRIGDDGSVEMRMPVQNKHTNVHKLVHGGIFVTMLDTAMGYACHLTRPLGVVTLNMTTSFIANCKEGALVSIIGRVVHSGRRIIVAEGEVRDEKGILLATAQGTFFVLGEHPAEGIKAPDAVAK